MNKTTWILIGLLAVSLLVNFWQANQNGRYELLDWGEAGIVVFDTKTGKLRDVVFRK